MYVGNVEKLKALKESCNIMDLIDVLMKQAYKDKKNASHSADKWDQEYSRMCLLTTGLSYLWLRSLIIRWT